MKTETLPDLATWVTLKAEAFAALHDVKPTQAELDDLFGVFSTRKWRWWLDRPPDYQSALLAAWLNKVRRMRGGSRPPADGDTTMLAVRALAKIEEIAQGAAAAILALTKGGK